MAYKVWDLLHTHTQMDLIKLEVVLNFFSKCTKYPRISSVNWTLINYLAFDFNFKQTMVYTRLRQQTARKQWVYL